MAPCCNLYDRWWFVTIVLCTYGFFKEMRPSEPYLTESLTKYNNVTNDEVSESIYPVWTYAYLCLLVAVFLFTDLLRYKPVIVFEALGYMATWSLLIWGSGVVQMQMMEFCYGIATSTEVAYLTYIYARVDEIHFQRVTGYVRAALLLGRFMSGVLSQSLISSGALNFYQLNYISFSSVSIAFCVAVCLPRARHSFYFHRRVMVEEEEEYDDADDRPLHNSGGSMEEDLESLEGDTEVQIAGRRHMSEQMNSSEDESSSPPAGRSSLPSQPEATGNSSSRTDQQVSATQTTSCATTCSSAAGFLYSDFKTAYSMPSVLHWSVFWAFATCGSYQVLNYIQPLWEAIAPWEDLNSEGDLYNGIVEAVSTLLGAASALLVSHLRLNWKFLGEPTLAAMSLLSGGLLLTASLTTYIGVAYVAYSLFRIIFQMSITICSFQVAKEIPPSCFGLVFGLNTFLALLLQTILTLVVVEKHGFALKPRPQFQVYGGYFLDLGMLFIILVGWTIYRTGWRQWRQQPIWLPTEGTA